LRSFSTLAIALAAISVQQANAAWTYSSGTATGTCGTLDSTGTATDFSITGLVGASTGGNTQTQTLKMAFVMPSDTSTHPDIIFVQRTGAIKYYTALTGTVTTMGTIPSSALGTGTEDGLIGVAFQKPNRVYVVYSFLNGASASTNNAIGGSYRLSRFDFDVSTKLLNMSAEKVILDVPSARNRWHTAGGLRFDNDGNLYWATGDNETTVTGPGNTHDLRGKILRIKPKDDGTYSIPAGNYAEVWANTFQGQGRTAMAAMYRDSTKVKPEIFVQGVRNAYVLDVEPTRKIVNYSQCGPDYGGNTEVWNITRTPIFAGWPWWAGPTTVTSSQVGSGQYGKNGSSEPTATTWFTPASKTNPVNTWTSTMAGAPTMGADSLPPFSAAKFDISHNTIACAMGSAVIRYDGRIKNPNKLPPQMDNVWLTGGYTSTHQVYAAKIDTNGVPLTAQSRIWSSSTFVNSTTATFAAFTDFAMGPDGALYVNNYTCGNPTSGGSGPSTCGGIARLEYKGTCQDTALHDGGVIPTGIASQAFHGNVDWLHIGARSFSVYADGHHEIKIMDARGHLVKSIVGEGRKDYDLSGLKKNSVYYIQATTASRGSVVQSFLRL